MYFTRTAVNISDSYVFMILNHRVLATIVVTRATAPRVAHVEIAPFLPSQEIYCQENMELIDEQAARQFNDRANSFLHPAALRPNVTSTTAKDNKEMREIQIGKTRRETGNHELRSQRFAIITIY